MAKVYGSIHGVCIRQWREEDIARYAELLSDPSVMRFIGNGQTRDGAAARNEIERFQKELEERGWSRWAVSFGEDGPFLGYAGFAQKDEGIDYGLRFLRRYWCTVHPYIATCLALQYGFQTAGFSEIYSMHDVNNTHAVSFTRNIFRSEPVVIPTEWGNYNKFVVKKDLYMERDQPQNERRIDMLIRRLRVDKPETRDAND